MPSYEECIAKIANEVSVQKEDRQKYTKDYEVIINNIMELMQKTDPVFKKIYRGPSLFGSYLDNIKLVAPDEFDVHFLLQFPFHESIKVERDFQRPGNVKLQLPLTSYVYGTNSELVWQHFKNLADSSRYFMIDKLKDWVKEILEKAQIDKYYVNTPGGGKYQLKYITKGVAHTVICKNVNDGREISLDLVPAFKIDLSHWCNNNWFAEREFPSIVGQNQRFYFAVPKPCGRDRDANISFSMCMPHLEKDLINGKQNLKPTLRLLKSIRDKIDGGYLMKSYFIKVVCMNANEGYVRHYAFWNKPLGELLLLMLDKIINCLNTECIRDYWNSSKNLLEGLPKQKLSDLKQFFQKVRNDLYTFSRQGDVNYHEIRRLFGESV
ncbi:cyclic GMP-AMP synthase-like protein isoform X2 [Episyrphus balteatus]|uniref:cyclic GMP-AMP synthase-like protein isoform X2 n=1 Tax=Episyrphus balteatus TaxID=286459 RepID=UPI0024852EC7|nr:cyclic GMP-AMP synthase-like protein isoform X2 [Episyrphus balteatus]